MAAFPDDIDPTSPAGTDLRSNGDDAIRKLAAATLERFTALVVDPDDDAMKLKVLMRFTKAFGGPVLSGATQTVVMVAAGVKLGDHVLASWEGAPSIAAINQVIVRGYVSADDEITLQLTNPTGGSITLGDTVKMTVIRVP